MAHWTVWGNVARASDCSPTSVVEVKNGCIFICTALCAFILATQAVPVLVHSVYVVCDTGCRLPCHIGLVPFHFPCPYLTDCSAVGVCDDRVTWHCVTWWYSLSASLVYISGSRKRSQRNYRSYGLKTSKSSGHYMYQQFNIQQFHVLPTQCIYVFCVDLRTNSDYFPIQH